MMRRLVLVFIVGFFPIALISPTLKSYACDAVGVVQSSQDPKFSPGQRFCEKQTFSKPVAPILVQCSDTGKRFWLVYPSDLNRCALPLSSKSSLNGNEQIFKARSLSAQNKPSLTKPFGRFTRNLQPTLEWRSVPGATGYSITIWGDNRQIIQSPDTNLTAASGMPILSAGHTYTIIIKAIANGKVISKSISALNVLSETQTKEVKSKLLQIERGFTNSSEVTFRQLSVLSDYHLVDDSIALLEKQISSNSNNAKFHRILAENYFNVGLLYQAKQTYEKAEVIAGNTNNSTEYKLAKKGLKGVVAILENEP
jgi:tetratricopeptide (TPR) repeat protein